MAIFQGTDAAENIMGFGGVSPSVLVTPTGKAPTMAADIIYAGGGNDQIMGLGGGDLIHAGAGRDTILPWFEDDTIYGGSGVDLLDLRSIAESHTVNLTTGYVSFPGTRIYQVENVITSEGSDFIRGSDVANDLSADMGNDTLIGAAGADSLRGGENKDRLDGGFGRDVLWGGADQDVFVFSDAAASTGRTADLIQGFEGAGRPDEDVIDLSGIDANTAVAGNQAFVFGTARGAGRLWVENDSGSLATILYGNTDRDAEAELRIVINDSTTAATAYRAGDFIL